MSDQHLSAYTAEEIAQDHADPEAAALIEEARVKALESEAEERSAYEREVELARGRAPLNAGTYDPDPEVTEEQRAHERDNHVTARTLQPDERTPGAGGSKSGKRRKPKPVLCGLKCEFDCGLVCTRKRGHTVDLGHRCTPCGTRCLETCDYEDCDERCSRKVEHEKGKSTRHVCSTCFGKKTEIVTIRVRRDLAQGLRGQEARRDIERLATQRAAR